MASIGHLAVGFLVGRVHGGQTSRQAAGAMLAFSGLAVLPDIDVVWTSLGVPDHGMLGHRGFTHSLIASACVAVALAPLGRRLLGVEVRYTAVLAFVAMASHGALDAATADGRGIPFLWPVTDQRFSLPWQPIPDPPTGFAMLSSHGLRSVIFESFIFAPILLAAGTPEGRLGRRRGLAIAAAHAAVVAVFVGSAIMLATTVMQDAGATTLR